MPHLTYGIKRPKEFKKGFKFEEPPNFQQISKQRPVPMTSIQESNNDQPTDSNEYHHKEIKNLLAMPPIIQPVNPLLGSAQHQICLRQFIIMNQLNLIAIENRRKSLIEQLLLGNPISNRLSSSNC